MVAALLIWSALATVAVADDGPMYLVGNGGSVRPMKNTSIRMAAETVQAICYSRFAEYKVDFRFENAGTTETVLLGFPFNAPYYQPPFTGGDTYLAPAGFRAWQDGRPLAVALVHGQENYNDVDYYTHRAIFGPGESTVTVDYLISPSLGGGYSLKEMNYYRETLITTIPPVYRPELIAEGRYDYTLHTGSYWSGNIGTAVLRWTLSPDFIGWGVEQANAYHSRIDTSDPDPDMAPTEFDFAAARIQSTYTTPAIGVYQWTLHDFSPKIWPDEDASPYDLSLNFLAPPLETQHGYANQYRPPWAHASSSLVLGPFAYPAASLVDGDPSTAWAEGAKGSGVGQWVGVSFPRTRTIRELRILSGYAKRPELFSRYNRPKKLRFDFSDGTSLIVTLADSPTLQRFLVAATANKARMTILSVYRGSVRNETYVSEVEFGSAPAPTFEDPGVLLAAARDVPSADATPGARSETTPTATADASAASPASAADPSAAPPSPLAWAALALTLVAVTVTLVMTIL